MSTRMICAIVVAAAIAAASCISDARAQIYLGAEGGWTGLEGTRDSIGPFTINRSFDSGFNVGARLGYKWDAWRFEGEYSHRENGSNATALGARLNGDFTTDSFMANAIYDFNVGWPITPHIGMGIGGAEASGSLNTAAFGTLSKTSDFVFAYQAIAGIRYQATPQIALDLDYRYRGMESVSYTARSATVGGTFFPSKTYSGNGNSNNFVASITYLFGPPPPPVAVSVPPPPPPAPPRTFIVFFDWDRDTLTPDGTEIVRQAAAAYRSGGAVRLQVIGYTDRSGSPGYNQRLSERRANSVAKALAGMGVPREQMAVSGRGENDNRIPTAGGVREPQNRRVEITT